MRYVWITADYLRKMLPGILAALVVYGCLYPWRCRRLQTAGLVSLRRREIALMLFWMFCGGMVLLTLTPREFDLTAVLCWGWAGPFFRLGDVNLIPFQTVRLNGMLLYILLGNILMFTLWIFSRFAVAGIYLEARPGDGALCHRFYRVLAAAGGTGL